MHVETNIMKYLIILAALFDLIFTQLFPGEGNGTPLQYSCLENPMDGGDC